jgi:cytochrome c553
MTRILLVEMTLAAGLACAAAHAATPVPDTLEERLATCAACHGKQGEGLRANEFYPRIAGKPAGYLYNQLVNFRDRRRDSPVMNYLVAHLSDDYLREIAEHYAKLPPSYPPAEPPAAREVLARGEALVMHGDKARRIPACTACHGKSLNGMNPAVPGLVGLDAKYVAAQMGAWRSKQRRAKAPDCMANIASLLAPGDVSAVTAWLASRTPAQNVAPLPAGALEPPVECGVLKPAIAEPRRAPPSTALAARGEYLVAAGNCISCHTVPGGERFAGGRAIPTPFGTVYSSNLTPDARTGLGSWSAGDFWRALHQGIAKDGSFLYPAFPFTNYTRVTRADADAMFAYLKSLPAVGQANKPAEMRFPYDNRRLLAAWRALYFRAGVYAPDPKRTSEWNRGAYLVQGLGHCSACHAGRNALGAVTGGEETGGGLISMLNWYAPSLTASRETGLGDWQVEEVVDLLKSGVSHRGAVFGPMSEVVRDGLQHLDPADLRAMVVYLKTQREGPPAPLEAAPPRELFDALMTRGERLYKDHCSGCHQADGQGEPRVYPPLADNEAILMGNPVNAIRITLNGGFPPSTAGNPRPYGMPPFAHVLRDYEVAAVVTYIRSSWGNHAAMVTPVEVTGARGVPLD